MLVKSFSKSENRNNFHKWQNKMLIFKIEKLNSQFKWREYDYERAFDTH